jgi:two-component system sensor histidine kinase MtrB
MTRRAPRAGLRASIIVAFALGALGLSTILAVGTYFSARHLLVDQRERTALRQAYTDAALVRDSLLDAGVAVSDVLGSVTPPAGAVIYVRRDGEWYSSSLDSAGPDATAAVQPVVSSGSAGVTWTDVTDPHAVVVGIPLPAVDAEYYEVAVAEELDRTLWTLALALAVSAALTTVAGGALGLAASRRVLAPLADVTQAAVRVSGGDMSTRLTSTDDPDLVALVGAFNNMVDALRSRIEHDARFAADVSHELRTPVTTLTTSLSLLTSSTGLSPAAAHAVRLMDGELDRFRRTLEDLLELGRLDSNAVEDPATLVGARTLVTQSLLGSRRPLDLLEADATGADPLVLVNRPQILRALTNLYRNADLHGGGLTGVSVVEHEVHVDLVVEDRGPGVPPEDRRRIFDRFARAGGEKSGTGSGLGLSIVEQSVHRSSGDVWCADRPGGGAVFVVRLPKVAQA